LKRPEPYLQHIIAEMDYLLKHSEPIDFQEFVRDETLKRSFERSFEIIGEATKNIPGGFKDENPDVPWKEMAGLRDVLIHHYFGVDHGRIWDIVKQKLPALRERLSKILQDRPQP
jgi:uncharacterized protein with HEPN domain